MEPVRFTQAKPAYVQGGHDPALLGLIPIGSKQTSVIVSNQSLMGDPTAQATSSMTETLAEQTIMAGGNRFVCCCCFFYIHLSLQILQSGATPDYTCFRLCITN